MEQIMTNIANVTGEGNVLYLIAATMFIVAILVFFMIRGVTRTITKIKKKPMSYKTFLNKGKEYVPTLSLEDGDKLTLDDYSIADTLILERGSTLVTEDLRTDMLNIAIRPEEGSVICTECLDISMDNIEMSTDEFLIITSMGGKSKVADSKDTAMGLHIPSIFFTDVRQLHILQLNGVNHILLSGNIRIINKADQLYVEVK